MLVITELELKSVQKKDDYIVSSNKDFTADPDKVNEYRKIVFALLYNSIKQNNNKKFHRLLGSTLTCKEKELTTKILALPIECDKNLTMILAALDVENDCHTRMLHSLAGIYSITKNLNLLEKNEVLTGLDENFRNKLLYSFSTTMQETGRKMQDVFMQCVRDFDELISDDHDESIPEVKVQEEVTAQEQEILDIRSISFESIDSDPATLPSLADLDLPKLDSPKSLPRLTLPPLPITKELRLENDFDRVKSSLLDKFNNYKNIVQARETTWLGSAFRAVGSSMTNQARLTQLNEVIQGIENAFTTAEVINVLEKIKQDIEKDDWYVYRSSKGSDLYARINDTLEILRGDDLELGVRSALNSL